MNVSALSEYENISSKKFCSESLLYQAINNVISITTTNGNKIFCPLCIKTFEFKFALLDHLKNNHFTFLCCTSRQTNIYEQCPFCYANFFGRNTIIKHVLYNHSKVIAQLYLQIGDGSENCLFCGTICDKKFVREFVSHIEQNHLLQFTGLFEEQFINSNDLSSLKKDKLLVSDHAKDDCFDFSHLKKELCSMQGNQFHLKSILKSDRADVNAGTYTQKAKACRILLFDTTSENKENSVLIQNINSRKQITLAEHGLLCHDDSREQIGTNNKTMEPLHCSTPIVQKTAYKTKQKGKKLNRKLKAKQKPTFKSYFYKNDFAFQCGKCAKLFQDNTELIFHIKKNHKMFIVNLLHPCYQCAICKAKFFKNYYLRKHVKLHSNKSF